MRNTIFLAIILLSAISCKNSKEDNSLLTSLVSSSVDEPYISSVDPPRGAPALSANYMTYSATDIIIKGRGFVASTTDNTVKIGGVQTTVTFATTSEIRTSVPAGAVTGLVSVVNKGGVCNSLDGKTGFYCGTKDFYIDCYYPFKNSYGDENLIEVGKSITVKYSTISTKAFRAVLVGTNQLTLTCTDIVNGYNLIWFSSSCGVTEEYTKTFPITKTVNGPTTIQFLIVGTAGECTATLN